MIVATLPPCDGMASSTISVTPRQAIAGTFRPFDHHHPPVDRFFEAEFVDLAFVANAVKVEMGKRETELVMLAERVARARHIQRRLTGQLPDRAACKRRLAGAEFALQRNDVAGLERHRDVGAKTFRVRLVFENSREPLHDHVLADRRNALSRAAPSALMPLLGSPFARSGSGRRNVRRVRPRPRHGRFRHAA